MTEPPEKLFAYFQAQVLNEYIILSLPSLLPFFHFSEVFIEDTLREIIMVVIGSPLNVNSSYLKI